MDSRLMITLDTDKGGQRFTFSLPQHTPFSVAIEAIAEFQSQILAWKKIAEDKQAAVEKESPDQQASV